MNRLSDIKVSGIEFKMGLFGIGGLMDGNVTIQNCTFNHLLSPIIAVPITTQTSLIIEDCFFEGGNTSIALMNSFESVIISNNNFREISVDSIIMSVSSNNVLIDSNKVCYSSFLFYSLIIYLSRLKDYQEWK